jgi:hypothetical protein
MRSCKALLLLFSAILLVFCGVSAQEKTDQGAEVHRNVRLVKAQIPTTIPEELKGEYLRFLPLFEEAVRENTVDESAECELTIRVEPGTKMIGSKKTPRATARVTGFRKNARREFVATLILHSYATGAAVNKEEISRFLKRRMLNPARCRPTTAAKTAGSAP